MFIVPVGNHSSIPFSRVSHSKYMVTEKAAYIGEWLGTCGYQAGATKLDRASRGIRGTQ